MFFKTHNITFKFILYERRDMGFDKQFYKIKIKIKIIAER